MAISYDLHHPESSPSQFGSALARDQADPRETFGLARTVAALVGFGLVVWGFRRKRSWLGRTVGAFGGTLIARSLGRGPVAQRVAAFIYNRTRLAGLPLHGLD